MKATIAAPALGLLIWRAHSKNSLTPGGLVAATLTGIAHAYHPWNLPFVLLCVFFLAGTRVTHIKEDVKAKLTTTSKGTSGGESPRTHVQVFANSLMASILSLLHAYQLRRRAAAQLALQAQAAALPHQSEPADLCFAWGGDLLVVGIIANYAAVAADTFSSELGILSRGHPRLLTSLTLRRVPPGTNGGVTPFGLAAGVLGSMIIVVTSMFFTPFCAGSAAAGGQPAWTEDQTRTFVLAMTAWGALGSVLDSLLGGLLQRSVRDARTGKIVEGEGGERVLVSSAAVPGALAEGKDHGETMAGGEIAADKGEAGDRDSKSSAVGKGPTRVVESGWDILDNNDVNFLMAVTMSIGAMAVAGWHWGLPLEDILKA